jgi:hypothetical protein
VTEIRIKKASRRRTSNWLNHQNEVGEFEGKPRASATSAQTSACRVRRVLDDGANDASRGAWKRAHDVRERAPRGHGPGERGAKRHDDHQLRGEHAPGDDGERLLRDEALHDDDGRAWPYLVWGCSLTNVPEIEQSLLSLRSGSRPVTNVVTDQKSELVLQIGVV